jgi:hypothetical protein
VALPEANRTSRLLTLTSFGRLRQGISIDQARAEFTGFVAALAERYPALRMAASTLLKSRSYLGAQYRRFRTKLGAPKAITAMAHELARLVYRL